MSLSDPGSSVRRQSDWTGQSASKLLFPFVLSTIVAGLLYLLQRNYGFSLWDDLWYGSQRAHLGEVPTRDFRSYEPGRYWLCSLFMTLSGSEGLGSVKLAEAFVQWIGLNLALCLLAGMGRSRLGLALCALVLTAWMVPQHKLFDVMVSIFLTGSVCCLIVRPRRLSYFLAGAAIGLAAVFGRNHALYGVVGAGGALGFLTLKGRAGKWGEVFFLLPGLLTGILPLLYAVFFIEGYFKSFVYQNFILLEGQGGVTNLALAVPWPWLAHDGRSFLLGMAFVFPGIFYVWILSRSFRGKSVSVVAFGSTLVGVPYLHHAFSRADFSHLAQSYAPFLIGLLSLGWGSVTAWFLKLVFLAGSLVLTLGFQPRYLAWTDGRWKAVALGDRAYQVDPANTAALATLRDLVGRYAGPDRSYLVVPYWTAAYSAFHRRSPLWEVPADWPRGQDLQLKEIEEIKAADPAFILLSNFKLDNREELQFKNTHPLVEAYIESHYQQVTPSGMPFDQTLYLPQPK
jgi:hypothetical protein